MIYHVLYHMYNVIYHLISAQYSTVSCDILDHNSYPEVYMRCHRDRTKSCRWFRDMCRTVEALARYLTVCARYVYKCMNDAENPFFARLVVLHVCMCGAMQTGLYCDIIPRDCSLPLHEVPGTRYITFYL